MHSCTVHRLNRWVVVVLSLQSPVCSRQLTKCHTPATGFWAITAWVCCGRKKRGGEGDGGDVPCSPVVATAAVAATRLDRGPDSRLSAAVGFVVANEMTVRDIMPRRQNVWMTIAHGLSRISKVTSSRCSFEDRCLPWCRRLCWRRGQ